MISDGWYSLLFYEFYVLMIDSSFVMTQHELSEDEEPRIKSARTSEVSDREHGEEEELTETVDIRVEANVSRTETTDAMAASELIARDASALNEGLTNVALTAKPVGVERENGIDAIHQELRLLRMTIEVQQAEIQRLMEENQRLRHGGFRDNEPLAGGLWSFLMFRDMIYENPGLRTRSR